MKKIMMMVLMMYLFFPITFSQPTYREYVHDGVDAVVYGSDHSYAEVGFISKTNPLDSLNVSYMVVQTMGVSGCEKNDVIIIYLTNGEKIIKKSWEEFNCDHKTFFILNEHDLFLLKNNHISTIRITPQEHFKLDIE